ncbi:MAG TPA: thiopurine S-methyltransferase [Herpetosiphonaceae bacterium]
MKPEFWVESWDREGSATSFHRPDIHPFLPAYLPPEQLRGKRVLVPLCGKTNDLRWFADHAEHVIGVELVDKAIEQFFAEQQMPFAKHGDRYEAERLTLLNRDIFTLTPEDVGRIDLVYDRAALVALPLPMRLRYVDAIDQLLDPGARQLVITLEYAPTMATPPFSIAPDEMRDYFAAGYRVEHVAGPERPEHRMIPKFGLSFLREHAFLLTKSAAPFALESVPFDAELQAV